MAPVILILILKPGMIEHFLFHQGTKSYIPRVSIDGCSLSKEDIVRFWTFNYHCLVRGHDIIVVISFHDFTQFRPLLVVGRLNRPARGHGDSFDRNPKALEFVLNLEGCSDLEIQSRKIGKTGPHDYQATPKSIGRCIRSANMNRTNPDTAGPVHRGMLLGWGDGNLQGNFEVRIEPH